MLWLISAENVLSFKPLCLGHLPKSFTRYCAMKTATVINAYQRRRLTTKQPFLLCYLYCSVLPIDVLPRGSYGHEVASGTPHNLQNHLPLRKNSKAHEPINDICRYQIKKKRRCSYPGRQQRT